MATTIKEELLNRLNQISDQEIIYLYTNEEDRILKLNLKKKELKNLINVTLIENGFEPEENDA